ncbi:MAG: DUF2390 domain-containing protein [Marinobacterium sp.]|nr:DUF2390 domain-containing protein [Marinobacterium sp.]
MATHSTTALQLDNPFWQFALQFWQQHDVERCCLELQAQGLSINRLLFCLWLAEQGLQLPGLDSNTGQPEGIDPYDKTDQQNNTVQTHSADCWQQQISHPLRALRFNIRAMKAYEPALEAAYKALRKAELACEQVEIAYLWQSSQSSVPADPGLELAQYNLQHWLDCQQCSHLLQHETLWALLKHWQAFTLQSLS